MSKPSNRLTKAAVIAEMRTLRNKIKDYCAMGMDELKMEHDKTFPTEADRKHSREVMIRDLLMCATYQMTNTLNLE